MKTFLSKTGTLYFISTTSSIIIIILCTFYFTQDSFFRFNLFSTFYLLILGCFLFVSILGFLPYYFMLLRINVLSIKTKKILGLIIAIINPVIFVPFFKEKPYLGITLVIIFSSGISFLSKRIILSKILIRYFVTLVYFWLNSLELAVERVKTRVLSGGHNIPRDVIYSRYKAGMENLSKLYLPLCDYWIIINNSEPPFKVVAEGFKMDEIEINDQITYNQIIKL